MSNLDPNVVRTGADLLPLFEFVLIMGLPVVIVAITWKVCKFIFEVWVVSKVVKFSWQHYFKNYFKTFND